MQRSSFNCSGYDKIAGNLILHMKHFKIWLILLPVLGGAWIWPQRLPVCFLIGDSISVHYGPYLEKFLEGQVRIERKNGDEEALKNLDIPTGASGGDSRMVLDFLETKIKDPSFRPDFFLFNFGLHDIKRNPPNGDLQVPPDQYEANLKKVISLLRSKNIKPVWIRTTPVMDSIHNSRQPSFRRYAKDLEMYNKVADQTCKSEHIPVVDLYSFTARHIPGHYIDHVHFDEETRALQAAFLAGAVLSLVTDK